jgi:integrase
MLRDLHAENRAGVAGARGQTVADYLDDWLAHVLPARGISPATASNYATVVATHITPALGGRRLDQLRPEHVEKMLRAMTDAGKARSTVRLARTVLGMALAHAERRDLVLRNAARLAVLPPGAKRESRSLTADEARALLAAAHGERLEAAWVVMLCLGLRPGEVLGLAWPYVDLDAARLTVAQAQRREPGRLVLGEPKTRKSRRTLDLPALVVDALRAHRIRQAAERLAAGELWADLDLVFPSERGTLMDPRNFRRQFDRVAKAAGLDDLHPHLLRHSAVSLLSAAGVPLEQVADVAGHATTAMTEGVYRHAVAPSVGAHVAAMDALFGSTSA